MLHLKNYASDISTIFESLTLSQIDNRTVLPKRPNLEWADIPKELKDISNHFTAYKLGIQMYKHMQSQRTKKEANEYLDWKVKERWAIPTVQELCYSEFDKGISIDENTGEEKIVKWFEPEKRENITKALRNWRAAVRKMDRMIQYINYLQNNFSEDTNGEFIDAVEELLEALWSSTGWNT